MSGRAAPAMPEMMGALIDVERLRSTCNHIDELMLNQLVKNWQEHTLATVKFRIHAQL